MKLIIGFAMLFGICDLIASQQSRAYEYTSVIALFPSSETSVTYNATITLPLEKNMLDDEQYLWFYAALGISNNSQVDHTTIQAKIEYGKYNSLQAHWVLQCVFVSDSIYLETSPVSINTPTAFVELSGDFDKSSGSVTLNAKITAAEDSSLVSSLFASMIYNEEIQFEASVIMEAQNVLNNGCTSFPPSGSALFTDVVLSTDTDPKWIEQNGEDDYSPFSPCNITLNRLGMKQGGEAFMYSWF